MKKLSILLIGLLLVAGMAFAADEFSGTPSTDIDITASVTFGVDLNTNYTGFQNAASFDAELYWLNDDDDTDFSKGGDDGLYGTIMVDDVFLEFDAGAWQFGYDYVEATIVVDPATITIYSAPSFDMDQAETIDSGVVEGDIQTTLANVNGTSINGITISVPAGPATVDLKVASDGDWTENAANEYVIGTDINVAVAPLDIDLGFVYGWFGAAVLGLSAGVEVDLAPATVDLGFDLSDASGAVDFDIAAGASVDLADPNDDDDATNVGLDAYIYTGGATTDLDIALGFEEFEDGGLMDGLYATATVELLDLLATVAWNVDVDGGYDTGDVDPYFGFGYGSDSIFDLYVGVALKAGLTGIDNTTITLDYVSTDLSVDNGIFTVMTEVAF